MRPRVSIGGLMATVLIIGLGLAALSNPTIWWASGLYTVTVGLLCTAVVATLLRRGRGRPAWVGFAVFAAEALAVLVAGYVVLRRRDA